MFFSAFEANDGRTTLIVKKTSSPEPVMSEVVSISEVHPENFKAVSASDSNQLVCLTETSRSKEADDISLASEESICVSVKRMPPCKCHFLNNCFDKKN